MTGTTDPIRDFFRRHRAAPIGSYQQQPEMEAATEQPGEVIELDIETPPEQWAPITPTEAPAKADEGPKRFIDGSHAGHAVLSIRSPDIGCAVPLMLSEVGGIAMNWEKRGMIRDFFGLERVVSMVADLFPWDQVEVLAGALRTMPGFSLRLLPANRPEDGSLFDHEQMRKQAQNRSNQEMADWEAIALASDQERPVLVDGRLEPRLRAAEAVNRSLVVGVIKQHAVPYLHPQGFRALLDLRPGQRTPIFRIARRRTKEGKLMDLSLPVASWYVKLGSGRQVGPNYSYVRVEVAWAQFQRWEKDQKGFTDRLSRWLIDARCRQASYSRMAVSLEPIVRAEDSLKSLFTPFTVLRNRFYLAAGVREEDV
jgi:hypothetical protein